MQIKDSIKICNTDFSHIILVLIKSIKTYLLLFHPFPLQGRLDVCRLQTEHFLYDLASDPGKVKGISVIQHTIK